MTNLPTSAQFMPTQCTPPTLLLTLTGFLSGLVLLSAAATLVAAVAIPARPVWPLIGFEVLIVCAGVYGVLAARGRFAEGPGLAHACVSGTIFAASVLGFLGATGQIGEHGLQPWLLSRVMLAASIGLIGAWIVLRRTRGAALMALRGATYSAAAVGFAGVLMLFDGNLKPAGSGTRLIAHAALSAMALGSLPLCIVFALLALAPSADDTIPKWMRFPSILATPAIAAGLLIVTKGAMGTPLTGGTEGVRIGLLVALSIVLTGALCAGVHLLVSAFASCAMGGGDGDDPSGARLPSGLPSAITPTPGATSS
ncbi:MAG TPA: hypothetical protein VF777_09635 [Phycisphaerales bacterium]